MNKLEILNQKIKEANALDAKAKGGTELSDEELGKLEALAEEIATLKGEISAEAEAAEKRTARLAAARVSVTGASDWLASPAGRKTTPSTPEDAEPVKRYREGSLSIPDKARRYGTPRSFMGVSETRAEAQEKCFRFGAWVAGAMGNRKYKNWCEQHGIGIQATDHNEGDNAAGGLLVPDEMDADMIDLREQYGVFRRFARNSPMSALHKKRLRRTGGLTAYYVGEQAAITKSTKGWDWVELTAKDIAAMAIYSQDLDDDSVMSLGNDLAQEISYAFAVAEDSAGFVGDGTSTYGRMVGITNALLNLSATRANIAGLKVGTGNLWSELVSADFDAVVAKLPGFAQTPNTRWFCHQAFYWQVMHKLLLATGGATPGDMASGRKPTFYGYPVEFTFAMPGVEANDQVACVLGDLSLAADFGNRQGVRIDFAREATIGSINLFETRQVGIRGYARFDINCHDVGNAHATAASRVPGPVVGLLTAAS